MKHLTFAKDPGPEVRAKVGFWKVQPIIDAFNQNRQDGFRASATLCVDESTSPWRGKDQHRGAGGCPHVTKITRKPKGVCMEIKNICDCASGVLMRLEIVSNKDEMRQRDHSAVLGAGTALLLRLAKHFHGSGRVIIADSAFASVKSAVALQKQLGLYFLGLVKTASRQFPKKYLNEVEMEKRGDHHVVTAEHDGVDLFAVSWNEGRKDKKTKKIARKNLICTCSTTLPGKEHFKKRWIVHEDGSTTNYRVGIPRPKCHDDYFSGAQKIDVHNHLRQGSLKCDERPTHRWEIRMFQTLLGMCEVDAYLAYTHFCPQQAERPHKSFLRRVILGLIHNKYGVGSDGPVLRPRNGSLSAGETTGQEVTQVQACHPGKLRDTIWFQDRVRLAGDNAKKLQAQLRCVICSKKCTQYCGTCTSCTRHPKTIVPVHSSRNCFAMHVAQAQKAALEATPPPHKRVRRRSPGSSGSSAGGRS